MENGYEVRTRYGADLIEQTLHHQRPDGVREEITRGIIRLQDEGVRKALIELGWTPPGEATPPAVSESSRLAALSLLQGVAARNPGVYADNLKPVIDWLSPPPQPAEQERTCRWRQSDLDRFYYTECGLSGLTMTEATIRCGCGGRIVEGG